MMRLGAAFIALCMVLIAGSLGAVLYLAAGMSGSVAAHEIALARGAASALMPAQAPATAAAESAESAATVDPAELGEPESERMSSGRFRGMDRTQVVALIAGAIAANRIDLHLQPIVSLPQRKVRFYEGLTRLRAEDGEVLLPADFLLYAESGGLM